MVVSFSNKLAAVQASGSAHINVAELGLRLTLCALPLAPSPPPSLYSRR